MRFLPVLALVVTLAVGSCRQANEVVSTENAIVTLEVENLPRLNPGEGHYQLWASFLLFLKSDGLQHTGDFISLGEFNIDTEGNVIGLDGKPARFLVPQDQDPQLLEEAVITIQSGETIDGPQSPLHGEPGSGIIGGKFRGNASTAVVAMEPDYDDALQSNFSAVSGKLSLLAPTSVPADSNSGVWFIENPQSPVPGLTNLPLLPEEWTYEGWVIDRTLPAQTFYYSTGKFRYADSVDFDGAGPGKGPGSGLNFPGQDFIVGTPSRPNLAEPNYAFMVTVEPKFDNASSPFFLKILTTDPVPLQRGQAVSVSLNNVTAASLPHGQLTVRR